MPSLSSPVLAEEWNVQIGTVWESLLLTHAVDRRGIIVEVGPGFTDKVGLGLAAHGFRGTLYVVEPNAAARDWVTRRYRQLLDEAEVIAVEEAVPAASERLPVGVDALLMNHVLDDMVLRAALPAADRDRVFAEIRPDQPSPLEAARSWERLLADPDTLSRYRAGIVADVRGLLQRTRPRVFAASQYASWSLTANGFEAVNRLGAAMLHDLAACLGTTSAADRAILEQERQNPDWWLVRERTPVAGKRR